VSAGVSDAAIGYDRLMTLAPSFEAFETDRLRAHFEFVVALLRAQPTAWLDEAGRCARERTLVLLEEYARRGAFPRNEATEARMFPSFVDSRGTECAVAHLMLSSGHGELVERVRAKMNFAYVREMATAMGEELGAWARGAGLTPAEAALVQPDYCNGEADELCTTCDYDPAEGGPGVLRTYRDGTPCGDDVDAACQDGECVEKEEGCYVSGVGLDTGSMAPLLAALVLLAARRRHPPLSKNPLSGRGNRARRFF
jgi:hypothetical protein